MGSLAGVGNVNLNAGVLTAGGNGTSTGYNGVISGAGGFIKAGSGTLTMGGNSTYSGSTVISGGVLKLSPFVSLIDAGPGVSGGENGPDVTIPGVAVSPQADVLVVEVTQGVSTRRRALR